MNNYFSRDNIQFIIINMLRVLLYNLIQFSQQPSEVIIITIPTLQMRKLKLTECGNN